MKFGLQHPNFTYDGEGSKTAESLRTLVREAEAYGFDSFWVMDHFHQISVVGETREPMLEGWTTISYAASCSSRIKLGTLVTGIVYRHPSVLAKIGATLDVLSEGRLFMGIGAAWNQEEATAYGIPFPPVGERMRRLEEAVQIIRRMWTEEKASFNGRFYQVREAYCNPKPIQKPYPPIMIGGSGERQTLKIAAKYANACNVFGSPNTVRKKLAILHEHCRNVGSDYDAIVKTKLGHVIIDRDERAVEKRVAEDLAEFPKERWGEYAIYGTPDQIRRQVEEFRDAGLDYLIVNLEPQRELEAMKLFAEEVAKKL